MVANIEETGFLYDIAYGLMPRQFEPTDEDCLIYDENDCVKEMYFVTDGLIGVGYSLNINGIKD